MMNGSTAYGRHMQTGGQHRGFQHGNQQHHHGHASNQPQGHVPHGNMNHQHSFSSGILGNVGQSFGSQGPQHGVMEEDLDMTDQIPDHWRRQLELVQETRLNKPNPQWHSKQRSAAHFAPRPSTLSPTDDEHENGRALSVQEERRQDWDGMDMSGQALRTLNPRISQFYPFLTRLYLDNNQLTSLPLEIGQLRNLKILNISQNQLQEIPKCIGMLSNLVELLMFDNQIAALPHEVGYLYKLEVLGIVGNPILSEVKEFMIQRGTKELVRHIRDTTKPPPPPQPRRLIVLDDSPASETFTILNYNILCAKYATEAVYPYTPSQAIDWEYRRGLILEEIKERDADIICLQEIDQESYNEYFRRELAYNDYKGTFWPKSRARTMADREAKAVDGCAIFFKGNKFILLDKQLVDFANIAINRPDMKGEHDAFNRVMPKDHIAVVCFFENRMTGARTIVACAHLTWDPAFEDVKLVQTAILMDQVSKFADRWALHPACSEKEKAGFRGISSENTKVFGESPPAPSVSYGSGPQIPTIICGDFNSAKGSGVYEFLTSGSLPGTHPAFVGRSYGNFTREGISHAFRLRSAYVDEPNDHLWFSNYTPNFIGLIDHIFFTPTFTVQKLLGNVDQLYLQNIPGFPHYHIPSDHLALYAEFSMEPARMHGKSDIKEPSSRHGRSAR